MMRVESKAKFVKIIIFLILFFLFEISRKNIIT